jgi:hypothetical protein
MLITNFLKTGILLVFVAVFALATVNLNGKTVKAVSGIIPISSTTAAAPSKIEPATTAVSASSAAKTPPVQLGTGQSEVKLPSDISDVAIGGGGKFLVLYLRKLQQFAIFDTNAKVVRYLPIDSDDILFTAGAEILMVASLDQNIISRYNLKTLEREVTAPMPVKGRAAAIIMGSNSLRPLLVLGGGQPISLVDPYKLTLKYPPTKSQTRIDISIQIRAAADGRIFGFWCTNAIPSSLQTIILEDNEMRMYHLNDTVGFVNPGPDGQIIYTSKGLFTAEAKTIGSQSANTRYPLRIPATQGKYYIEIDENGRIALYHSGDSRALVTIPKVGDVCGTENFPSARFAANNSNFPQDKHIYFIPDAHLIIGIPKTNDRLILQPFDLLQALKDSNIDYLFVSSQPVTSAVKNSNYIYQIIVESKRGGVKYSLESGPAGMKITPDGKLTWTPGATQNEESIIVRITDASEQEIFHTFKISVR